MTKPEPRLFALKGIRRGGPKKRSKGPKNSWKGSSSPPGAPCPRGPPFTSWVLEMFTTDGATCSVSPAKSGRLTDGEDVAPPPPLGFSAPPKMLSPRSAGTDRGVHSEPRRRRSRSAPPPPWRSDPYAESSPLLDATSHQLHVPHAQIVEHRVEERFFTRLEVASCLLPQNAEDVDHLLGRAQVALESVRHRVRDLTQVEEGLRAEPEHEGRERDRFIGALGGGRGAFGGRRLGQRGRGRLLGGVGARLSAVGEPAAVPHLEPASLLLVLGHGNAAGAGQYAIARSLRMRSSMGGWVLNKPASQLPRSGFTIQRCAVAGPAGSGTRPETAPIFSSAAASECGAWESWAPLASA